MEEWEFYEKARRIANHLIAFAIGGLVIFAIVWLVARSCENGKQDTFTILCQQTLRDSVGETHGK